MGNNEPIKAVYWRSRISENSLDAHQVNRKDETLNEI